MAGGVVVGEASSRGYPGKMTPYVCFTCIVAAMGGLIFGYDIGISGGVTSMDHFLHKFFPSVYKQQHDRAQSNNQYCTFDSVPLTLFTSSLYIAALLSSFVASWLTKRLGRKVSMLWGGLLFLVGAAINAAAKDIWMLIIGRLFLGAGVGFSIQSVPLYVSEMAPYKYRGALNVLFQLSITIGILAANIVNYFTVKIPGGWGWRVSLGLAAVPAVLIVATAFFLPDTPNSMLDRNKPEEARAMLRKIRGLNDKGIQAEFDDLVAASQASHLVKHPWRNIWKRQYRPQLTICTLIPLFQQMTGINVVMFYAPVLFKTLGFGSNASLMSAVITGVVNVVATFLSVYGTDKWGRRKLFFAGGGIMFVFQLFVAGLIGYKFGTTGVADNLTTGYAAGVIVCICAFVAAFAFSWGPLGWLVPSEISPLEVRSPNQSITVSVNMMFTFLIAQLFLSMLCHMKYGLFIFFAGFVAIMTGFVYFFVPETMNIPIEEMVDVWKTHPFWKRFVTDDRKSGDVEIGIKQ
ncbi:unnamed protein product [Rhodiola kirilowii]